jgi:hypothetical protein
VAEGTAHPPDRRELPNDVEFRGPDGRALFRLAEVAGETVVVWLRVGNHGIYNS